MGDLSFREIAYLDSTLDLSRYDREL